MGVLTKEHSSSLINKASVLLFFAAVSFASDKSINASLTTTYGSNLDPKASEESITIEPLLSFTVAPTTSVQLYTAIDRPTNQYEDLALPKTMVRLHQGIDLSPDFTTTADFAFSALNLHRWKHDGYILKPSLDLVIGTDLGKGFGISTGVGPYLYLTEYKQTTAGSDFTKLGTRERLSLTFANGRFSADAHLVLEQYLKSGWKNDYRTYEQVAYQLDDIFSLGLSHELLGSFVDAETGGFKSLDVFDERKSRISAFVIVTM